MNILVELIVAVILASIAGLTTTYLIIIILEKIEDYRFRRFKKNH